MGVRQAAPGAAAAGVHGFAVALTSFVGRAEQLAEVAGLLGECRLVTVTGPGGVGKTRLAGDLARGVPLAEALAGRQLLLVLDNCEHLAAAVADLCGALLLAADDVRVLATSREPLRVPGEACYRLPPLGLPGPGGSAGIAGSEAVMLFAERARRVDPHFTLGAEPDVAGRIVAR